jgi:hypothetical protein
LGRGKVLTERPNLPEPPKTYSPAVESRVGKINAARAAETGLNAAAERGRIGDPASESNSQILARAVTKAGFGGNFVEKFKKLARKNLIASETTRVGGDKKYVPDDADVTALAHEMARRKADNHPEPQMRSVLRDLADTGFNYQASGNLVKGIQKVEPEKVRKGLLGNQVVETPEQERERRKAQFIAQERRPARIAEEGVGDVAMRKNIAEMNKLEAEAERALELGDIQLAEELKQKRMTLVTDFESRFGAEGIMSGDFSPADTSRTATNVKGINAEERVRGAKGQRYSETRIDTADKGSENEGLKNIPGTIATEPTETSERGWAVIASDPKQYNKYLERFSDADVEAIEKAWSKFEGVQRTDKDGNKIPGRDYSPIEQMRRGEILAKFAKGLGIEALGKHGEITAKGMNKGVVRGPEEEAIANERVSGVRASMNLIDDIISGKRSYSGLNKHETLRETGKDIRIIVDSLKNTTGTKNQRSVSERGTKRYVTKAINSAAAGNQYGLSSLRQQMASIIERGQLPEQQIASAVGSAPQVEAMLGDVGTRIRGGASTIAMRPFEDVTTGERRKGIGPAKIPLATEPVRTGGVEGSAMRESVSRGAVLGESSIPARRAPTGSPARERGVSLRAQAERIRAANQPKEPEAPAPREFKDLPKAATLHDAVLEFKKSLDTADVNYGEGGTKSNLQMSRIDRLTRDYVKEMRKNKPNRVPRQISNVRELSRAQAELDKLKAEVALNNKKLDEVRRITSDFKSSFKQTGEGGEARKPLLFGPGSGAESAEGYSTNVPESFGMYMDALQGRIKVLQGSVTEYEKVLEKAYSTGKLKPGVTRAALREGERGEMSPRMMDIDRLKRRLDDRNLAPKERARIEKTLSRIRVEEGGFQNPPEKKAGPIKPSAAPMSTAYVSRRFDPITDEREIVPGQKPVGNVIPPKGRRKSETRKRAARNRKFPEKQYGTRSSDISTLRGAPDAVQRLLEGLPR